MRAFLDHGAPGWRTAIRLPPRAPCQDSFQSSTDQKLDSLKGEEIEELPANKIVEEFKKSTEFN
jgi:hypothetical protein